MAARVPTQNRNLPLLASRETCEGRTYIITGANTGLGFEAAKHLATLGAARVILAVRNIRSGEAAKEEIDMAAGTANTNVVEVWPLDLSSYASVRAFAKRAADELDRIDALIENAALALATRETAEGHLIPVTVNVVSTILLAVLLLPEMSKKAKKLEYVLPCISIVSSSGSFDVKDEWEKIKDDPLVAIDGRDAEFRKTYELTKLTATFASRYLARVLVPFAKTGVIVNTLCPGLCVTKLARHAPQELVEGIRDLHARFGRTAENGSRTLLHAAVAGPETHGLHLDSCEIGEHVVPSWIKDDTEGQKHTWDVIAKELEAIEPGCVARMLQCAG